MNPIFKSWLTETVEGQAIATKPHSTLQLETAFLAGMLYAQQEIKNQQEIQKHDSPSVIKPFNI